MYDISAEAIIELIKERLGISAAEEFPAEINPPYCLVLTPAARIEAADMGRIFSREQTYRIELYTRYKKDPLRDELQDLIYSEIPAGEFNEEEGLSDIGRLYLTAIEFSI